MRPTINGTPHCGGRGLTTQVSSALIDGISGALFGKASFEKGAPVQGNVIDYSVLEMGAAPPFAATVALTGQRVGRLSLLDNFG